MKNVKIYKKIKNPEYGCEKKTIKFFNQSEIYQKRLKRHQYIWIRVKNSSDDRSESLFIWSEIEIAFHFILYRLDFLTNQFQTKFLRQID